MSSIFNIFDSIGKKENRLHRQRLLHLENAIATQDNGNALLLLESLIDDKEISKRQGRSSQGSSYVRSMTIKVLKFISKVVVVVGLLYTTALVFAFLEDEETELEKLAKTNNSALYGNGSSFLSAIQLEYDIQLTETDQQNVEAVIADTIKQIKVKRSERANGHPNDVSHLKIQKWFYFVVIASTTIGYGDVCPKTQRGKIFYCCFSVVGIVLMMSLLQSCGVAITWINKRFYRFVRHYLLSGRKRWSEESISLLLTMVVLIAYLALGICHDKMSESDDHSLADIVYFWMVSFTTVGFGDIGHSLDYEIKHAYELTVYRVFGLSLVAAIIDTILSYCNLQKEILKHEKQVYQRKMLRRIRAAMVNSERQKSDIKTV